MRIAIGFLRPDTAAHITTVVGGAWKLRATTSPDAFCQALSAGAADVALIEIDPRDDVNTRESIRAITHALEERAAGLAVPFVVYAAGGDARVLDLVRAGAAALAIRGFDDHPSTLGRLLNDAATNGLAARVLSPLEELLVRLPASLRSAIRELFHRVAPARQPPVTSVADLARAAGLHRRALDRSLAGARLTSASRVLACARVTTTYRLLRQFNDHLGAIASRAGYESERRMVRDCKSISGLPPGRLRTAVEPDQFVSLVTRCLASRERNAIGVPAGPVAHERAATDQRARAELRETVRADLKNSSSSALEPEVDRTIEANRVQCSGGRLGRARGGGPGSEVADGDGLVAPP